MTIKSSAAIIDQITALPAACRRGGGRAHEVYWTASAPSSLTETSASTFSFGRNDDRRIVNFGRKRLTFAYRSNRTGTLQQGEGPWEYSLAKHLETHPSIQTYELHKHRAIFRQPDGGQTEYGPDAVWANVDGSLICAEVKASESYFKLPATAELLDMTERGLARGGIRLAKITGDALQANRRLAFNVGRAFVDGQTRIGEPLIDRAKDLLAGGPLTIAALGERLGIAPGSHVRVVNALLVRRAAAYDMSAAVTPDTIVTPAPVAMPAADLATLSV